MIEKLDAAILEAFQTADDLKNSFARVRGRLSFLSENLTSDDPMNAYLMERIAHARELLDSTQNSFAKGIQAVQLELVAGKMLLSEQAETHG